MNQTDPKLTPYLVGFKGLIRPISVLFKTDR